MIVYFLAYFPCVWSFLSFTFAWIILLRTIAHLSVFSAPEQIDVSYAEITPECSE